jgi:membrane fusion protein (multidrug efflux system)
MNARVTPPAEGEAEVVKLPSAEAPRPAQPEHPTPAPQPSAPQPATPPPPANEAPSRPRAGEPQQEQKKRGPLRLILMIIVPLILVVGGVYFWLTGGRYEDTDNAYVTQPIVSISADVAGRITEVDVKENQHVSKGDVLFKLDPAPFKIALDQAEAALSAARLNVQQLKVNYASAKAKLASDQKTLVIQQRNQERNNDLAAKGVATAAAVDQGLLAVQQAQAAVTLDQQAVAGALAALNGDPEIQTDNHPSVQQALAQVEQARLNLGYTTVTAPASGVVSQVASFNVGQYLPAGTTVVSLVEADDTWVEANFKETQLGDIKVGQPATVVVDTYGGTTLHGTVQSIQRATGAVFSLIPPQNATGNWVKVVQRIPVRIAITPDADEPLASGMSATVTIDTGRTTLDKMLGR